MAQTIGVSIPSNLDISITVLSSEICSLIATTKSGIVSMGHKIIALRELLRQKYGMNIRSQKDVTGNFPPNGWRNWVRANLSISPVTARSYMKFAVDPETAFKRQRINCQKYKLTHKSALAAVRRAWPKLPLAERNLLIVGVLELYNADKVSIAVAS